MVDEYHRKVRTIAGGIQAGWYCRWMFAPPNRWVGFHYVSWKLAKYMIAWWALLALIAVLMLSPYSKIAAVLSLAIATTLTMGVIGRFAERVLPGPLRQLFQAVWYAMVTLATPFAAVASLLSKRATTLWRIAPR